MRAHRKTHVQRRRSWQRPLKQQVVMTVIGLGLILAGHLSLLELPTAWAVAIKPLIFWPVLVVGVAGVVLGLMASDHAASDPSPVRLRLLVLGRVLATLGLALMAAWHLGLVTGPFGVWAYPAGAASGLAAIYLAPVQGLTGYLLRRRMRRPNDYVAVHDARSPLAVMDLRRWLRKEPKR